MIERLTGFGDGRELCYRADTINNVLIISGAILLVGVMVRDGY